MSIRLTCSICKKPDSKLAIIFDDPSEIDDWLPYICIECEAKGYSEKDVKGKEKAHKVQRFEDSDLFKEMKENEEKEKMGLIRCPLCDRFSSINEVRKKGGSFVDRLCDKCKPKI